MHDVDQAGRRDGNAAAASSSSSSSAPVAPLLDSAAESLSAQSSVEIRPVWHGHDHLTSMLIVCALSQMA